MAIIGVLKSVSMELCGMESIDLTKISMKILGIPFFYNKKSENEKTLLSLLKKLKFFSKFGE